MQAARNYIKQRGHVLLKEYPEKDIIVFQDDEEVIVFAYVNHSFKSSYVTEEIRELAEQAMIEYFYRYYKDEFIMQPVRIDTICVEIISENKALVKHYINGQKADLMSNGDKYEIA